MYKYILFPGRHHLLTNFQADYLSAINEELKVLDLNGEAISFAEKPVFVFAMTSANHSLTRRNPISSVRRLSAIEKFCAAHNLISEVYFINDIGESERFADHLLKEIEVQSRSNCLLTKDNTVLACSTPSVIEMYTKLGFKALPVELIDAETNEFTAWRPWDLLLEIVQAGSGWRGDAAVQEFVHPATTHIYDEYGLDKLLTEVFADPLLGDEGDITETRNYKTYRQAFEDGAQRKYDLIAEHIQPGKIVDVGCATGEVIKLLSEDEALFESDLYGIEVARPLFEICQQRKSNLEFTNENVFFYQRNISESRLFEDDSVHTTLCLSLTHEIESYLGHEQLLHLISQIYQQTAPGGVFINLDVTGPPNKDQVVLMWLNSSDGLDISEPFEEFANEVELRDYLNSLSTRSRFLRFAKDFRAGEGDGITWQTVQKDDQQLIQLSAGHAAEFLMSKEYTENWHSEMHEKFCFWNQEDWRLALTSAGFDVDEASRYISNPWIIDNWYQGKAKLFDNEMNELPFPPTNVLMVAKKL